jgi:hypothetical protein
MHCLVPCLAALLAASLAAQTCIYTGSSDPAGAGQASLFLLENTSPPSPGFYRTQTLLPAALFQNVPVRITEISIPVRQGFRRSRFAQLTIRMGQTTVTQLSTVFAQNITSPLQNVLVANNHVVFDGVGPAWVPLGLQQPYLFLPGHGNLIIEVVQSIGEVLEQASYTDLAPTVLGTMMISAFETTVPTTGGLTNQLARLRLCVDHPELSLSGIACGGSQNMAPQLGLQGTPSLGSQTTFWLGNMPANGFALLAFGFDNSPPYPMDLTPQGAPGCRLYFPIAFTTAVFADPLGLGQHVVTIPNSLGLLGTIVLGQYVALEPGSNTLGVLTSNYGRVLVGR